MLLQKLIFKSQDLTWESPASKVPLVRCEPPRHHTEKEHTMEIKFVEELPPLVRRGNRSVSEQTQKLRAGLETSLETGKPGFLADVLPKSREFTNIGQNLRTIAKTMGIKVSIQGSEDGLYFIAKSVEDVLDESANASDGNVVEEEASAPKAASRRTKKATNSGN